MSSIKRFIGDTVPCLDHGFIKLVDYMGSDIDIVNAARISTEADPTRKMSSDQGLINYLMRKRHTSPFEMVEFKFHCKMPIFVARRWVRHRTASINEYSMRYREPCGDSYVPEPSFVRPQSKSNKQGADYGSELGLEVVENAIDSIMDVHTFAEAEYEEMVANGVAKELARVCLPLSTYTEWYWKIDLHNLFGFLSLRLDESYEQDTITQSHAQGEIAVYARAITKWLKELVPMAWQAFATYTLNARTFSALDMHALGYMQNNVQRALKNMDNLLQLVGNDPKITKIVADIRLLLECSDYQSVHFGNTENVSLLYKSAAERAELLDKLSTAHMRYLSASTVPPT